MKNIKFKSIFLAIMMVLMSVIFAFGCGGNNNSGSSSTGGSSGSSSTTPGNSKKITVGIVADSAEEAMMQRVIEAYKAKHESEGYEIGIRKIAGVYNQQITNLASSGELPDVFANMDSLVGYLAKASVSLPLDEYFEEYNVSADDFYESVYNLGIINGKVHMLPREYAHLVIYYNKELTDKLPNETKALIKNGWTWNDFVTVARALAVKKGNTVIQYGADLQLNWETTVMTYIYGMNGKLFSDDKTSCVINDQATQIAYATLKGLVDEGAVRNTFSKGTPDFMSGAVGMYASVRPQSNRVNNAFDKNWDVVSFPKMPNVKSIGSGTTGYSVSAYSTNRELAIDFLMYMMSEEGMQVMSETGVIVPARKSLNTPDAVWRNYPRADINQEAFVYESENDMLPMCTFLPDPSNAPKVLDALNKATEAILGGGTNFNGYATDITANM